MGLSKKEIEVLTELKEMRENLNDSRDSVQSKTLKHQEFQSDCLLAIVEILYQVTEEES